MTLAPIEADSSAPPLYGRRTRDSRHWVVFLGGWCIAGSQAYASKGLIGAL